MQLLATRDTWWMTQCEAALLAEGITSRWVAAEEAGAALLEVEAEDLPRVVTLLSELLAEELRRRQAHDAEGVTARGPILLQPAFAAALSLAVFLVVFHLLTSGVATEHHWFERGALFAERALAGEYWRLVTAATLHADARHALGNAGFLVLLGWAAGERLGFGAALAAFLFTAVVGFLASLGFGDAAITVGASGGLFGLLGVAAGHAVRHHGAVELPRVARLRAFGAGVLFLAFTAFNPGSNIQAHVGGFVAGVIVGFVAPRAPARTIVQVLLGLGSALVIAGAWLMAATART